MPLYDYRCKACGHEDVEVHSMFIEDLALCPKCGKDAYRKQVSLPHTDLKEFSTPIELHSIACNDAAEIRAMQEAGIEISTDPKDELFGVPIARTRKQKLAALKVAGYVETK